MHTDARGYVYETYREGGRVCRRYVGRGEVAGAVLYLDRLDRQRDEEKRQSERSQIEAMSATGAALDTYCGALDSLVSVAMTAAGYHRHKRGEWRKRRAQRENTMLNIMLPAKATADDKSGAKLKAAQKDEGKARAWLDNFAGEPEEAQIYALLAPVQKTASEGLIVSLCGGNELAKEAQRRQLKRSAQEIAGPNPTPLETQLADRVALCALSVARMENIYASSMSAGAGKSLRAISLFGRELDAAHRRHLSAVKTLATVRKAQLPDVQINIAEKQVNIGTLETR